jgi:hypothetical protein
MLLEAKKYKTIASNNYTNPEQFDLYIAKTKNIIKKLKEKKLYLNDVQLLEQDLNTIKKTFD